MTKSTRTVEDVAEDREAIRRLRAMIPLAVSSRQRRMLRDAISSKGGSNRI